MKRSATRNARGSCPTATRWVCVRCGADVELLSLGTYGCTAAPSEPKDYPEKSP
jgi:hypothetical protein